MFKGIRGRSLKYGQACDRYMDKCVNGAKCIDKICKCSPGFLLAPNGWCEGFDLAKAIEMNKQSTGTTSAPKANRIIQTKKQQVYTTTTTTTTTRAPVQQQVVPEDFPTPPSNIFGFPDRRTTKPVPKVAAVGSACRPIDICLGESVCTNGFCHCPENFIRQNGQCISTESKHKVAKVGQTCKNGEICAGGSICDYDTKRCICAAQHVAIKGICKQKSAPAFAAPGDTCSMREKCTGGANCVDGMCTCDDHHFAEDGYCRPIEARSSKVQFVNGAGLRFSSMQVPNRQRAQPCNEEECKLPNCFCSHNGRQAPGGLRPDETPQFVVLTFDDAVNGKTFPDYKKLFENDVLKNPNGCDVKATFFISHEWTNYDAVNWLVQKGMEIASNSISHESLEHENTNRWLNEMDGQRRILAKFGGAPEEQIVGIRSPQLALGGDNQFEMMVGAEFLWDNSMSANPGIHGEPFWPQTMDYQVAWDCHEASCPKSSFPGVWTVPLNQFYGSYMRQIDSFRRSSMLRAAVDLNNTVDELEEIIMRNFERSYTANRAPYVLSLNADFLQLGGHNKGMKAVQRFLNKMSAQKDVYIVTIKQLIDWMKRPVPISQMKASKAVGCPITLSFNRNPSLSTCDKPNKCLYSTPSLSSQEHQFLTCLPCPTMYPWLENPAGGIV
ncbi:CBN-LGX-1 protein [Caenorhabditis brenneri]|uniref:CBN-LGX-1 protein n=1 Tax=Caenorhabditis brenneri TaxID=135651 RepID=G0M8R2_CAEBE|nr:CBN-LGX-1 protein [Caenorhabditis brenneri]